MIPKSDSEVGKFAFVKSFHFVRRGCRQVKSNQLDEATAPA